MHLIIAAYQNFRVEVDSPLAKNLVTDLYNLSGERDGNKKQYWLLFQIAYRTFPICMCKIFLIFIKNNTKSLSKRSKSNFQRRVFPQFRCYLETKTAYKLRKKVYTEVITVSFQHLYRQVIIYH